MAWLVLGVSLIVLALVPLTLSWTHSPSGQTVTPVGSRDAEASVPASRLTEGQLLPRQSFERAGRSVASPPVGLQIPKLGVSPEVVAVGQDASRSLEIPADVDEVGWYHLGVAPGAASGSAVLVGHRDGRGQGRGAFYDLGLLDLGDRVEVTDVDGQVLDFRVVAREAIAKTRLPVEDLFALDGPPRLTLISCGGYYDPDNGGYQENVVITAVLNV